MRDALLERKEREKRVKGEGGWQSFSSSFFVT